MPTVESSGSTTRQDMSLTSFHVPKPRSLGKFLLYPRMWRIPDFRDMDVLFRRVKTNLLYFQTNYLILDLVLFMLFMILSMKTVLTGVVSAVIIALAALFFFDHIPQARQIKQNYPTFVIVGGILLIIIAWHAIHTILIVIAAALAPIPLWFLHAAMRSSDNLLDGSPMAGSDFVNTPMGQIMQMFGIEPRASMRDK